MIRWDNIMNTNELIQSRNDNQTRMRSYNDPTMNNYYPINIGVQPIVYNFSPQMVLNASGTYPIISNTTETSLEQNNNLTPILEANVDKPIFRIANWHDIADKYEGVEQRPKCGKLSNNVYFTQRATTSDIYMLFDKKSDYINYFVNYYFSDKNLARDTKLVALMDDNGIIPLSALIQFPKLQQIDSTVDDLIKAFQTNNIVTYVEKNGFKGVQRRDKWSPLRNQSEKQSDINNDISINSINEQPQTIVQSDAMSTQNQQYFYMSPLLSPPMYSQQPSMMTNISGLPSYPQYAFLPFPSHQSNQPGLNVQPSPTAFLWPIPSNEYGNQSLLQHMPIARFNAPNMEAPTNR